MIQSKTQRISQNYYQYGNQQASMPMSDFTDLLKKITKPEAPKPQTYGTWS